MNREMLKKMADLRGADLTYADLRDVDLTYADLRDVDLKGADLTYANLRNANLTDANLTDANLTYANLTYANLRGANLTYANLKGANLRDADLKDADLKDADLTYADLTYADLRDANLTGANLKGANLNNCIISHPLNCPEVGSFIGWKKARGLIVKLEICEDALRSSSTTRKCRCSKAKVLAIETPGGKSGPNQVASTFDENFIYRVGEIVEVNDFDVNRWEECSTGIHFFITRDEAVCYF